MPNIKLSPIISHYLEMMPETQVFIGKFVFHPEVFYNLEQEKTYEKWPFD
jgi:hypothetical protein